MFQNQTVLANQLDRRSYRVPLAAIFLSVLVGNRALTLIHLCTLSSTYSSSLLGGGRGGRCYGWRSPVIVVSTHFTVRYRWKNRSLYLPLVLTTRRAYIRIDSSFWLTQHNWHDIIHRSHHSISWCYMDLDILGDGWWKYTLFLGNASYTKGKLDHDPISVYLDG